MASDAEVVNWFVELGMKVEKVTSGNYYFHITIGPPVGEGLKVSVLRKTPSSKYYVIAVNLDLPEDKLKERPGLLTELKLDLLRMNVEFVFMPPDQEVPRTVQIAKLAFLGRSDQQRDVEPCDLGQERGLLSAHEDLRLTAPRSFRVVQGRASRFLYYFHHKFIISLTLKVIIDGVKISTSWSHPP